MPSWLTSLEGFLTNWMVNPWLLLGGAALLAAPILIHLLNKRRYRPLDWAAIDFLLEADLRNRRRIRVENLLLLLLRCLAVLLIALLLARPFRPQTFAGGALQSVRFERVVVLDDSLSMRAIQDGESSFDRAKKTIAQLVAGLSSADTDESFSLVRLSQPERPVISGVQINDATAADLKRDIGALDTSDLPIRLDAGLLEVEKLLSVEPEYVNRILYVVSDMRSRDWSIDVADETGGIRQTLTRMAKATVKSYVVDVGPSQPMGNLTVMRIVPRDKVLVAGVSSPFDVVVANHGRSEARNVQIGFSAGESLALTAPIDSISAKSTETVSFSFTFAKPDSIRRGDATAVGDSHPQSIPIRVTLSTDGSGAVDQLPDDNQCLFAARVEDGIRTLIVDGDPSAAYAKAETFSLQRALAPPGDLSSGVVTKVVTDVEFDAEKLDDYHAVYLCNLYRLTEKRRRELTDWVVSGGGLIIFPGDQIDERVYNETLYRDGAGLLPARLSSVVGDESEESWVHFQVSGPNHPALNVFAGENNPFTSWVKVFRRWEVEVDPAQQATGDVWVSARFSDPLNSPAVLEKKLGEGRVVFVATAADRDWNNWPLDPSYLIFTQELTRYVVNKANRNGTITVGQSIRHPLDLLDYKLDATVTRPDQKTTPLEPRPDESADNISEGETGWIVDYADVDMRGFYELNLLRASGAQEETLFAANVDEAEGDLERVDMAQLHRGLKDAPIEIVDADALSSLSAFGAEGELWPLILCLAVVALCGEQALGWFLGRNR